MGKGIEGPLTALFGHPQGRASARVLDQALYVGNMEQTIQMLAESTGLHYKTVKNALEILRSKGLVEDGRKMGNARTFKFNVEGHLHDFVTWARRIQLTPSR